MVAVRDIHEDAEAVALADHVSAERREPAVQRPLGGGIADLVGTEVHHLQVAQPRGVRGREVAEVALEEIRALRREHHRGPLAREGAVDVVTLTAPSTLSSVCEALGDDAASVLAGLTVASIGPITTAAAEKAGVRVDVSAREYTAVGLVESLVEHFRAREGASPR